MWMAPNLVTFSGFLLIVLSVALVAWHDLTFRGVVPGWVFVACGVNLFLYQTLDAVDGKQARRTQSSSPLGQLFDHGCDSFTIGLLVLMFLEASHIEFNWAFYILSNTQILFYVASLREKYTGVLLTHVWNFGVTELTFIIIAFFFITAWQGQAFWQLPLSTYAPAALDLVPLWSSLTPLIVLKGLNILFTVQITYVCCHMVWTYGFGVLLGLLPLYWLLGLELAFFLWVDFFAEYAMLVLLGFMMLLSMIVTRIIICSLTHMRFPSLHL